MVMVSLFLFGFILGLVLRLFRNILGDSVYNVLRAVLLVYLAYKFFSIFGFMFGIIIIVGVVLFLLMGVFELAKNAGTTLFGGR